MHNRPALIVPSFNGVDRLPALIASLAAQTDPHELIVVDNASRDGTSRLLSEQYPEIRVLTLPENVGFGRAVNRGVAATDASTIVLGNDDAVYDSRFVEMICAALDPSAGVVMAAGVLLSAAAPDRIDSAGLLFDRALLGLDYLKNRPVAVLENVTEGPFSPTGGAAAYDRAAFDAVGGFDERYFAYLEDLDLTIRLIAAGGRCGFAPSARGVHLHSATLGARSWRKDEVTGWSRGYTIAKYRLQRRLRLLPRLALGEAVIVCGQLVRDRTTAGGRARIAGFRAGRRLPPHPLPELPKAAMQISLTTVLRHRLGPRALGR